ncbi:MAG: helix-turn-helix transcriptional regulator [Candidatus Altiarchaeota archaeon]|nr:helix-turn-helix transcriptional regulator [Candidatus Altiarchaeota archaeon]
MSKRSLSEFKKVQRLSNQAMAKLLDVSSAHLSMILSGQRTPSRKLAQRISERTGIPILNLLYPEDEARP